MSNKHIYSLLLVLLTLFICLNFVNCRKQSIITNSSAMLSFSEDTILFDTIFTTIGSTTKYFKIYNNNNGPINISSINLANGTNSQFRINVNGDAGVQFENIELEKNDSLFIFVEVTIDPNNITTPLIVEDSILFSTNNNIQKITLNAWGQDAYFHVNEIITQDETWNNDKPHVIYNYCAVDENITLTIPEGTIVHSNPNAVLYIYKSSLQVNGTINNSVTFQQDRMEDFLLYNSDSTSGQWRGIRFFQPLESNLNYAEIKNATIGIQIDTLEAGNFVNLNSISIHNSLYANLLTQGGNLNAVNCLFGNSSQHSAFISIGGNVDFEQCTFGNYWQGQRNSALMIFKDYYQSTSIEFRPFNSANFTNCIFYGSNTNELFIDTLGRDHPNGDVPVFNFTNCLVKLEDSINNSSFFSNCFNNQEPLFNDPNNWDFSIPTNSIVVDKGASSSIMIDILANPRTGAFNDLGCFEAQ